ncbi:MAG TPA: hypothetical protein VL967_05885 [Terracidiphilus sp.]|nr:hypothetical protein [Terracidiphilus sp.]
MEGTGVPSNRTEKAPDFFHDTPRAKQLLMQWLRNNGFRVSSSEFSASAARIRQCSEESDQGFGSLQRLRSLEPVQTMRKQSVVSDKAFEWIIALLALAALIEFGRLGMPQKWHAAIVWTAVAFGPITIVLRKRWSLWAFWLSWSISFSLHLIGMWLVFADLLAKVRYLGTLYVVPFAAIEAFVLLVLLAGRKPRHQNQLKSKRMT